MKIGNPSDKPVNGAAGGARTESTVPTQTTGKTASLAGPKTVLWFSFCF